MDSNQNLCSLHSLDQLVWKNKFYITQDKGNISSFLARNYYVVFSMSLYEWLIELGFLEYNGLVAWCPCTAALPAIVLLMADNRNSLLLSYSFHSFFAFASLE